MLKAAYPKGATGTIVTSVYDSYYFSSPPAVSKKSPCQDALRGKLKAGRPTSRTSSFKKGIGGPRGTVAGGPGWAPCRPYTRGIGKASASGSALGFIDHGSLVTAGLQENGLDTDVLVQLSSALSSDWFGGVQGANPPDDLLNRASTELLGKIARQDINLGSNAVELRSSVGMVARRAIQLLKAFKAVKRMDLRGFFGALGLPRRGRKPGDTPSSLWLEYVYGWLPLCQDIYAGTQLISQGSAEPRSVIFSATRQVSRSANRNGTYSYGSNTPYPWSRTSSCRVRAKAWYRITDQSARMYQRIGLTNPLQWAWEALPYSFVIDWFLPVGNFLLGLTAMQGCTLVDACLSVRVDQKITAGPIWPGWMAGTPKANRCSDNLMFNYQAMVFDRKQYNFRSSLYIKNPFSSIHVLNALALWTQLRRRA